MYNANYISETTRHISTRVCEHLVSDKASRSRIQTSYVIESLSFKIKIKAALHIKRNKPVFNQQLQHFGLSLFV